MDNSIRLGRIGGIEIDIHYTWALAFVLIGWSLAAGYFPSVLPDAGTGTDWVLGIAAALLLFVSVLIHELSLAGCAPTRPRGVQHHAFHLWRGLEFGGVSNSVPRQPAPGRSFWWQLSGLGPAWCWPRSAGSSPRRCQPLTRSPRC
jgi:Zn-dependent protease